MIFVRTGGWRLAAARWPVDGGPVYRPMRRFNQMTRRLLGVVLASIATSAAATDAWAERKVALVIGNGKYTWDEISRLPNPSRDAQAMYRKLDALGFEVSLHTDLGSVKLSRAVDRFVDEAEGADVALFFYAGHSYTHKDQNYILPVDIEISKEDDLNFAKTLQQVLERIESVATTRLVFFDACRNELDTSRFFGRTPSRGNGDTRSRGLSPLTFVDDGTFVAYSTAANELASDGDGDNSPFTDALVAHLDKPNITIKDMMTDVTRQVKSVTGGEQIPFTRNNLSDHFFFNKIELESVTQSPQQVAKDEVLGNSARVFERGLTPQLETLGRSEELESWRAANDSGLYETYYEDYCVDRDGRFCKYALARMNTNNDPAIQENKHIATDCDQYSNPKDPDRIGSGIDDAVLRASPSMREKAARACRQALQLFPDEPRIMYQFGRILQAQDQYETAAFWYQRAADKNYPISQLALAKLRLRGNGVAKDPAEAIFLLNGAANAKLASAQTLLGVIYATGHGVPANLDRAIGYLRQASDRQDADADALLYLGKLYEEGSGDLPRDIEKAKQYYRQAAAHGSAAAERRLARLTR